MVDWMHHAEPAKSETPHVFGGHSDLCLHCGIGEGMLWWNRRGEHCATRSFEENEARLKKLGQTSATVEVWKNLTPAYTPKAAATAAHLQKIAFVEHLKDHKFSWEKPQKLLRISTGRKFR